MEDAAACYPRNRHADQVCKTFYRFAKEKKCPKPMLSQLIKVSNTKGDRKA